MKDDPTHIPLPESSPIARLMAAAKVCTFPSGVRGYDSGKINILGVVRDATESRQIALDILSLLGEDLD